MHTQLRTNVDDKLRWNDQRSRCRSTQQLSAYTYHPISADTISLACIFHKSSSPRDLRVPWIYAHERSSDAEAKSHKLPLKRKYPAR